MNMPIKIKQESHTYREIQERKDIFYKHLDENVDKLVQNLH